MPRHILILFLATFAPARADPAAARAQLRARLETEWRALAAAPKAVDWRITYKGKQFAGDWVVHLDSYRYFIAGGKVRCQVQADRFMWCDGGSPVEPRWTASPDRRRVRLATMKILHRAVFRTDLGIDESGHAIVEALVRSGTEERLSQRYRAHVELGAQSFTIGQPFLVEEYREDCVPINGCHSTTWSCHRRE